MQYPLCRHIRTNGKRCHSPAMSATDWCFFHRHLHDRHRGFRHPEPTGHHLELAALEDRESVQVALSVVINALASGQLETRRATALLYGLQLASMNAGRLNLEPHITDVVRTSDTSPEGLALAEPGLTPEPVDLSDLFDEDDD